MTLPPVHPIADIWPLMNDEELVDLAADIQAHGQWLPIVFVDGLLLDGRNRWLACEAAGVEPRIENLETDDPDALAWSLNEHRRHAPIHVRQMAAARWANMSQGARTDLAPSGAKSQSDAAAQFDVSRRSVQRARTVLDHGDPVLTAAVESGDVAVSLAAKAIRRQEQTGEVWSSVADIKRTMRKILREEHPPSEPQTETAVTPSQPKNHVGVDTFGVVRAVVRHADKHSAETAAAQTDKWTRLNILDDLPPAIEYLTELQSALKMEAER